MGDAPRRSQSGFLGNDLVHELVGVEAALHQRVDLAAARHGHGELGSLVAVARGHEPIGGEVDGFRRGDGADLRFGADEHRNDEAGARRLDRAQQRAPVDRMDDGRAERC